MPIEKEESVYLKFIDLGLELAKSIPRYFSRFSNKIFCNHQHLVLLVLRQKLKMPYREFIEFLKITKISLYIGLRRIPHYTTLQKFARRLRSTLLGNLGLDCIALNKHKKLNVGVDGTGFSLESASRYYAVFAGKTRKVNRFMQLSIAADLSKQLIATSCVERKRTIISTGLVDLVKPIAKTNCIRFVAADKGYDTNENHSYVTKCLKIKSCIKVREKSMAKPGRGNLRKRILKTFDEKSYHQRSKVETIFSVIKRRYGSSLKSRNYSMQKKELLCRVLAYNLDRLVKLT